MHPQRAPPRPAPQFDAHLESQRGRLQAELAVRLDHFRGDVAGFASRCAHAGARALPCGSITAAACASLAPAPANNAPRPLIQNARRWAELRPRGGPGGNPAVVLAQLEGVGAQLEDLRAGAARLEAVRGWDQGVSF